MANKKQPLFSLCIFGRNDNYTPDFLYRMSTTINYFADAAEKIGRLADVEIVVTDWASEEKLANALDLSVIGAKITRFIYVDPDFTESYSGQAIPANMGVNIGVRRASGSLVGFAGAEVLIPSHSIEQICQLAEQHNNQQLQTQLYVCGRFRLPASWVLSQPSVDEWNEYLALNSWRIEKEPGRGCFLTGNAGFFLFTQEMLAESTGFYQALDPYWGWNDVEYTVRMLSRYPSIDLNTAGVSVFDMEHLAFAGTRNTVIKTIAPRLLSQSFAANGENWGAGDTIFVEDQYTANDNNKIDFELAQETAQFLAQKNSDKLHKFLIWVADNLEVTPDQQEIELLHFVFCHLKATNLLRFKEYAINSGFTYYLVHFLFEHLMSIGVDKWSEGGGEFGPNHIAYNLTTAHMEHKGHNRLVNLNTDSDRPRESLKLSGCAGLVICRADQEDQAHYLLDDLVADAQHHQLLITGQYASKLANIICCNNEGLHLTSDPQYRYFLVSSTQQDIGEQSLSINDHTAFNFLVKRATNWSKKTTEQLITAIRDLNDTPIILWCNNELKIELLWPHIQDKTKALISTDALLAKKLNIKHINLDNLPEYGDVRLIFLE